MDHSRALDKLCRVCGKAIMPKSAKVKHLCSEHTSQLMTVFNINVEHDNASMHPKHFCHPCLLKMKHLDVSMMPLTSGVFTLMTAAVSVTTTVQCREVDGH